MEIGSFVCNSCAVGSLTNVGTCNNPVEVLTKFCKQELGYLDEYRKNYGKLICFYVFCAGPEVGSKEPGGSHHSKDHWPRYGTEFAQYIIDNSLGEIVTLGPKKNDKHHPTTTAQVWVWSPNSKELEKWWTAHQEK